MIGSGQKLMIYTLQVTNSLGLLQQRAIEQTICQNICPVGACRPVNAFRLALQPNLESELLARQATLIATL